MIQTIFKVNGETYSYDGSGQEAASAALKQFEGEVVLLDGFLIDGRYVKAKLSSR